MACGRSNATSQIFQIRHGYRTEWNGLAFSVEHDSTDWTLRVQDFAKSETLYTARRYEVGAAQRAAMDFAIFRVLGCGSKISPDRLASELKWQEYW